MVQLFDRRDTEEAEQLVGRGVEQADERTGDGQVDQRGGGQGARQRLGPGQGEVLGREFAEHHLDDRRGDETHGERDGADCAGGYAERFQSGSDQLGQSGFGDEPDHQRGDGDAQLRTGQHERQPLHDVDRFGRLLVALGRLLAQQQPVGADVGELLGDEVAGGQGEHEDGQQAESHTHRHRTPHL